MMVSSRRMRMLRIRSRHNGSSTIIKFWDCMLWEDEEGVVLWIELVRTPLVGS